MFANNHQTLRQSIASGNLVKSFQLFRADTVTALVQLTLIKSA
jgi:hypothetical protein